MQTSGSLLHDVDSMKERQDRSWRCIAIARHHAFLLRPSDRGFQGFCTSQFHLLCIIYDYINTSLPQAVPRGVKHLTL